MTEAPGAAGYVELHCHSSYSLCDGASTPDELAARAAELGMDALALTDHDALYGAAPFAEAARARGVRPIFGAELTLEDGAHVTLLAADSAGWSNLCRLVTIGQAAAPKGSAALPWDALLSHADGLVCLTGCRRGPVASAMARLDSAGAARAALRLAGAFGRERTWVELQHHLHPGDSARARDLVGLARHLGLGYVLTNNVHYARRAGRDLHDLLTAVRHRTTLDSAGRLLRGNSEYYLKAGPRLLPLLVEHPEALAATRRVAALCALELRYGLQDLPEFPTPPGVTADEHLAGLCAAALPERYPGSPPQAAARLRHELGVIARAGLSNYLLVVWDIVAFARARGVRCQGRGSAASSLVAFLLGISPIDPLAHDLVFERFLSDERPALPDIDVDIAADRREEVIQYALGRYGRGHAAMACTFSTFRSRSALREVAAALDLPLAELLAPGRPEGRERALAGELAARLAGLPRHLGQHSGGVVLTRAPLSERLPVEPAAMPGRAVVQWDKDMLESAGIIKVDLLGLRMLSALTEAERLVRRGEDPHLCLDRLTLDDPQVYAMVAEADTVGVFQVESRAQAQVLPRLRPERFEDLVVAISLIRPGPIQGDMVHPYLRRRQGLEPVAYLHPLVEGALRETLGVILFQEQVLKVARDLAGLTPGEGERLRRALGSGRPGAVAPLREAFMAGAAARGVPAATAAEAFAQLEAFGGYSFPKSHAAAFAVVVYQSAYLKRYHPAALLTALLNNQPMGFWPPTVLVRDARRHGVRVEPLDVQLSAARCTLEGGAVRLGLASVLGLGAAGAARVLDARAAGPFADLADLCRRTRLPRRLVEHLIFAGACDGWGLGRRRLLWQLGALRYAEGELELGSREEAFDPPPLGEAEAHELQQRLLGVSTAEHPLARWRGALDARGYRSSADVAACAHGERARAVGTLVLAQQPPTAKGFMFLTLEDELGMLNVILRPGLAAAARPQLESGGLVEVEGVVQREAGAANLLALRVRRRGEA